MMQTNEEQALLAQIGQRVQRLQAGMVLLALGWLATASYFYLRVPPLPPVLVAQRLDIVEPDGQPAFVLANSQRPAPATLGGKVILADQAQERRGAPSFVFFNGKGDEVGALLVGDQIGKDGVSHQRHLSLDAFQQDQTVVLSHVQDSRGASAGLTVSDRPDFSLKESLGRFGVTPGSSKAALGAALAQLPAGQQAARMREAFGTMRAFVGTTRDGAARLELRDAEGRTRVLIEAPKQGAPSLVLLDEQGQRHAAVLQ